jgi:hypothetical protein
MLLAEMVGSPVQDPSEAFLRVYAYTRSSRSVLIVHVTDALSGL